MGAAGGKAAAGFGIDRAGDLALEKITVFMETLDAGNGNGSEESFGIGMEGVFKNAVRIGNLDTFAQIHDHDASGNVANHGEIVGDEEIGKAHFLLKVHEEIENLGLDGHIQS